MVQDLSLIHISYNEGSPFSYAALKNINLNIPEGKVTAVIGETGSCLLYTSFIHRTFYDV